MNNSAQSQQGTQTPIPASEDGSRLMPLFKLVLFLLLLLVVFAVGFYARKYSNKQTGKTIMENESPIGFSVLQNPIVNQWSGAIEGTVIAKDNVSLTVKDDAGNTIVVPDGVAPPSPQSATLFFDQTEGTASPGTPLRSIRLESVQVGSRVKGNFFVVPGAASDKIVGGSFVITAKPL